MPFVGSTQRLPDFLAEIIGCLLDLKLRWSQLSIQDGPAKPLCAFQYLVAEVWIHFQKGSDEFPNRLSGFVRLLDQVANGIE